MFFKKLRKKASDVANRYQGSTDFLEAFCALCALVGSASGDIDEAETETTLKAIIQNPVIKASFDERKVREVFANCATQATSRPGRRVLWSELEDIKGDPAMGEAVVLTGIDVADSDGDIDGAELKVLKKAADMFGLDLDELIDG